MRLRQMALEGKNSAAETTYFKLMKKYAPDAPDDKAGYAV